MIPRTFLSTGISTADIAVNNLVHHIDFGTLHDEETVANGSKSKMYCLNKVDATVFYYDFSLAQMDCGNGVSVINLISLLYNVKFFDAKFKSNVCMHDATSKLIITPRVIGYMRVWVLTRQGFIDEKFYYLPYFSITLPSQVSIIEATGHHKQYIPQGMQLFFIPNKVALAQDLTSNSINLNSVNYNHNYGTCMPIFIAINTVVALLFQIALDWVFALLSLLLLLLLIKMILKLLS